MKITPIQAPAITTQWHETETVRRILGQMAAQGFPSYTHTVRQGIWSDDRVREYDRDHAGVSALLAARNMWFEIVGECGDNVDQVIAAHEARYQWQADFLAAIDDMCLDYPPHHNAAIKEARTGDVTRDPAEAAREYCAAWTVERKASIDEWHRNYGAPVTAVEMGVGL